MTRIASLMTKEEKRQAAEYYEAIPFRSMVRVVETEMVPQVETLSTQLVIPIEDAPWVPLGNQIVEVPENPNATEALRDPHTTFISYVPIGSVAKGKILVETGGGKTIQCNICHGPGLQGLADVPGIAGRTASYNMRQMWDVKRGTRLSPLMTPVVANLSSEDMLNILAYVATLSP
jgi:cytochrome c553